MSPLIASSKSARGYGLTLPTDGILGSFDALATITVPSGGASSIEFMGVPQNYRHLQLRGILNSTSGSEDNQILRFNTDSGSNYSQHLLYGSGSNIYSTYNAPTTSIPYPSVPGSSGNFTASIIDILDYSSLTKYKTIRIIGGWDNNSTGRVSFTSGNWMDLRSITSIKFTTGANIAQYSTFTLYGVK